MTFDEYFKAFSAGVAATREGFNGECLFDHCSPDVVDRRNTADVERSKEVQRLAREAFKQERQKERSK